MIRKMVVQANVEAPNVPSTNPRYLGMGGGAGYNLYRTPDYATFTLVASSINTANGQYTKAFSLAAYTAGEVGGPWAFIASELKLLKDSGNSPFSTLELWGILPAFGVATAVSSGPSTGVLDGGAPLSPGQSQPYDWRYTYIGQQTNFEGNPSQTMLADSLAGTNRGSGVPSSGTRSGTPIIVHLESVVVTVWGTGDPQVANINIYRRGGLLYDTWRLVGTVANPGIGNTAFITDNISDEDLQFEEQVTLDNDPPVDSAPTAPITGTVSGAISPGEQTVNLTIGSLAGVTAGSLMHFFYDNPEDVIIVEVQSNTRFIAYFQHSHSINADFEIDTITGQPCNLAIAYQQFILVAGDPNNPHLIYRSKGGLPEAFPVVPADGSIATCACGSPSNPILNMFEFRGQVLTLNLYSLFETLLLEGSFIPANQVAYRGLVTMRACCKTDSEVWFLSTDGIWSWDGGSCRKRSQAIDPIFHGQETNGFLPLSYTASALENCVMEYRRGQIYFVYMSGNELQEIICEPQFGDRWRVSNPGPTPPEFIYTEPDTGSMIEAYGGSSNVGFQITDQNVVYQGVNYTADGFTTGTPPPAITGGSPIAFDVRLPWFDFGTPSIEKVFEEVFLEVDTTESSNSLSSLSVDILYDFSDTADAADTATIVTTNSGRNLVSLLTMLQSVGGVVQSYGRGARAVSFHIYGSAYPTRMTFFSLVFVYQEETMLTAGGATDWQSLGGNFDKRAYQMTVEFDTRGINQTIALDTVTGIGAGIVTLAAQTFILNNPVTSGPGRAQQTFPLADETIFKLVRVRPYATAAAVGKSSTVFFKIFSLTFPVIEQFPPDFVTSTPWKLANEIVSQNPSWLGIDADTGGVAASINLQNENGTALTVQHTGTVSNRRANYPIQVDLFAKMWRLLNVAGVGATAKIQLFSWEFTRWQPTALESGLQPPDIVTWTPWRDTSSPDDKEPSWLWIDAFTNGIAASVKLANELGLVMTVAQTGTTTNRRFNYATPVDATAKMWRLLITVGTNGVFQCWNWGFSRWHKFELAGIEDPPEIVLSCPWSDFGYPFPKLARALILTINTGGIACQVQLETSDNGIVESFEVTTTYTTRRFYAACNPNLSGLLWRPLFTPGAGGLAQVWDWAIEIVKLPPALSTWTSYQNSLGYAFWKFLKTMVLEYVSPVTVDVTFVSSTGTLTITLPAHATRSTERYLFPTVFGGGLNKSVLYDMTIAAGDGVSGVSLYADASEIEFITCGSDRHAPYSKAKLSSFMQIPI
jgi:hypothetical protein